MLDKIKVVWYYSNIIIIILRRLVMKKIAFIFKNADAKTRIIGIVALALAALALLTVIISANTAINGPITKLPVIELFVPEEERDELDDYGKDLVELIEDAIDEDDDDLIEELEDEYDMPVKKILKLIDPVSLNGVKQLGEEIYEGDEETVMIFTVIVNGISAYAFIIGLFVALAGIFMNKALFIIADVFSALFFFVFVGAAWFFIFTALCIAYCILVSKVKKAYNAYRSAPAAEATVEAPAADPEV